MLHLPRSPYFSHLLIIFAFQLDSSEKFTLSDVLDKPGLQVPSFLPPRMYVPSVALLTDLSVPTFQLFMLVHLHCSNLANSRSRTLGLSTCVNYPPSWDPTIVTITKEMSGLVNRTKRARSSTITDTTLRARRTTSRIVHHVKQTTTCTSSPVCLYVVDAVIINSI